MPKLASFSAVCEGRRRWHPNKNLLRPPPFFSTNWRSKGKLAAKMCLWCVRVYLLLSLLLLLLAIRSAASSTSLQQPIISASKLLQKVSLSESCFTREGPGSKQLLQGARNNFGHETLGKKIFRERFPPPLGTPLSLSSSSFGDRLRKFLLLTSPSPTDQTRFIHAPKISIPLCSMPAQAHHYCGLSPNWKQVANHS